MTAPVLAATAWPTNAHLMEDVARLGYLDGTVLDCTYGRGSFWTRWRPGHLIAADLRLKDGADLRADFTRLPFADRSFDAVVFDPPYRLNGTPDRDDLDDRYGVAEPTRWQDRMARAEAGAVECARVTRRFVLIKCQDQVVSGAVRWQTRVLADRVVERGGRLVDVLHMVTPPRPQPPGRRQVHARRNLSALLVLEVAP